MSRGEILKRCCHIRTLQHETELYIQQGRNHEGFLNLPLQVRNITSGEVLIKTFHKDKIFQTFFFAVIHVTSQSLTQ